jgi:hypothetical protein
MSAIKFVFIALAIIILASEINAQYYYPYYYGNQQMAYNNYYQSQAPSPQQQAEPVTLPSTIFSFGSPAYAKTSDLFVLPKFF